MERELALQFDHVEKQYHLYPNRIHQTIDRLGFSKIPFIGSRFKYDVFSALRDISFTIKKGERVAILGRNGAGKSTLLKMVTQRTLPTAGNLEVKGQVQALMVGGIALCADISGKDNVRYSLLYSGLPCEQIEQTIEEIYDFTELGKYWTQPVSSYSLGMRGRLEFAIATALKPDILLIDEMLGAGDGYFTEKSAQRMESLILSGCTLLLVSHSMSQLLRFCERAIWIDKGVIRADGPAKKIITDYEKSFSEEMAPQQISTVEGHTVTTERAYFSRDTIVATEQTDVTVAHTEVLLSEYGQRAERWASRSGLKVTAFDLDPKNSTLQTGSKACISIGLIAEKTDYFDTQLILPIYSLDGQMASLIKSDPISIYLEKGETLTLEASLDPLLLGSRHFIGSIVVANLKASRDWRIAENRFDLLSRCLHFTLSNYNDSDPPLIHSPGNWFLGESSKAQPAIISGIL